MHKCLQFILANDVADYSFYVFFFESHLESYIGIEVSITMG